MNPRVGELSAVAALAVVFGCDSGNETGKQPGKALGEIASSKPSLMGQAPPAASVAPAASSVVYPVARRPSNAGEVVLTPERRARIEQAYPEAKGFIDASEIEQKLFALDLSRGKESQAIAEFDKRAARKWVLFTGAVGEPHPGGPELPVRYTPRDARDPLGLTSTWFTVKVDDIKGWDPDEYKPGEQAVVLAKYRGKQKASPGYDLILLDRWYH